MEDPRRDPASETPPRDGRKLAQVSELEEVLDSMYLCEVILWTIVGCSPGNHVPTWGKAVDVMYPQEKPYWIAFSSMRDSPSRTLLWTLSELPRPEHHSGSGTISKLAFPSRSRIAGPPEWKMITHFPPEWSQKSSSLDPAPSNKLPPALWERQQRKGICK